MTRLEKEKEDQTGVRSEEFAEVVLELGRGLL